jgi:hypothetical protein
MMAARFIGGQAKPGRLNHPSRGADDLKMRRVVVLVCALLALTVGLAAAPTAASAQADPAAIEAKFVADINALRASKGLPALSVHPELVGVARDWAAQMAKADQISHNPRLAQSVKSDWQKLGENVGVGMTEEKLHQAFVDSPAHYRNLVDPDFTYIGVGVVFGRDGAIFTAHEFMQLRSSSTSSSPTTTAPKAASRTRTTTTTAPPAPAPAPPAEELAAPPAPEPKPVPVPPARLVLELEQLRALDPQ